LVGEAARPDESDQRLVTVEDLVESLLQVKEVRVGYGAHPALLCLRELNPDFRSS